MMGPKEIALQQRSPTRRSGYFPIVRWCPFWVGLLVVMLAMPTELSFHVGTVRLSPYRIVLIAAFVPALIRLLGGKAGPVTVVDWLLLTHVSWAYIVLSYHHGAAVAMESGGIRMLELAGAYLVARAYLVNERSFRGALAVVFATLVALTPLVLVENITGVSILKTLASGVTGDSFQSDIEPRHGLWRAFGPFDHPILLGVFAASTLGVATLTAFPKLGQPRTRPIARIASVLTAVGSLSSGALAALVVQVGLMLWARFTQHMAGRWRTLTILVVLAYLAVDTLSNRSGYQVFLHYLTFSAHTAYTRVIIFEWGIQEVWRNPVFGIGFHDWTRPAWLHSASMDNFWLMQAVTFGIPGFMTLALATLLVLCRGWKDLTPRLSQLRLGWTISMVGMIVAGCTVHFWNSLFVYFSLFMGAGAWFANVRRRTTPRQGVEEEYRG